MSDATINQITTLIVKGIAKGATAIAQATVRTIDVDHNALDVAINGALPTGSNTIGAVTQGTGGASAWKVDGSAVTQPVSGSVSVSNLPATQPVSGTVTANIGTSGSLALNATLTDATQRAGVLGANGTTIATTLNRLPCSLGSAVTTGSSAGTSANLAAGIDGGGLARGVLLSAAGNTQTSPAKGTSYSSAAAEISKAVSAAPCLVSKIRVQNLSGSTRYVHIFNASSLPANGTVPAVTFTLVSSSSGEVIFPIPTDRFSTGCVVAASTALGTLTISATADFLISVDFFPSNA